MQQQIASLTFCDILQQSYCYIIFMLSIVVQIELYHIFAFLDAFPVFFAQQKPVELMAQSRKQQICFPVIRSFGSED